MQTVTIVIDGTRVEVEAEHLELLKSQIVDSIIPHEWEPSLDSDARQRNKERDCKMQDAVLALAREIGLDAALEFANFAHNLPAL